MMNNKGQTLIFFVIILPVILFIFMFTIDLGILNYEKNKLDSVAKKSMEYKLDGKNDDEIVKFVNLNIDDAKIKIYNNKVILKKEYKSMFLKVNIDEIKSVYTGYRLNNKNIIKKGGTSE